MVSGVQIVKENGIPVAAVLPWNEYKRLSALDTTKESPGIPHAVMEKVVGGCCPVKAWRLHLKMTQKQAAQKIGISQAAYAQMENVRKNRTETLKKITEAFGLDFDQMDMI